MRADLEPLLLLEFVELGHELDGADQLQHPDEPADPSLTGGAASAKPSLSRFAAPDTTLP